MPPQRDDYWRELPSAVLDQDRRQQEAHEWGAQQRAEVATEWGNTARAEVAQLYPGLVADAGAGPPMGSPPVSPPSSPRPATRSSSLGLDTGARLPPAETSVSLPTRTPSGGGGDWLSLAQSQLGKPYIWGSQGGRSDFSPETAGFDCSGFVSYVYKNALGINLPAQTRSAYAATKAITAEEAQPGDIVLWLDAQGRPDKEHIAIYMGDGKIIQSGGTKRSVNVDSLGSLGSGYQFRRAAGAESALANEKATVALGAQTDTIEQSATPLNFGRVVNEARNALGGAVQTVTQPVQEAAGEAATGLQGAAQQAAQRLGLDPSIFTAQLQQESGFKPDAVSPAGARGVAQFMPGTAQGVAKQLGVSLQEFWADPNLQIQGAAQHMRDLLDRYGGDYAKALAAYNAGPGAVDKYGGIPPFKETQHYVNVILGGKTPTQGQLVADAGAPAPGGPAIEPQQTAVTPSLSLPSVDFGQIVNQARQAVGFAGEQMAPMASQLAGGQLNVAQGHIDMARGAREATTDAGTAGLGAARTFAGEVGPGMMRMTPGGPGPAPGESLAQAQAANEFRRENFPSALEPGHPSGIDFSQPLTSQQQIEIGGTASPLGGAGKVAKAAGEAVEGVVHGLTINLPKHVPEEVRGIIQQAYDANPTRFDEARRGVIPDDVVADLAQQTGQQLGLITSRWKPGRAENAETILALREGLNAVSQDVIRAQRALQANPASGDALNAVTEALTKHAAIQEVVTGVTAEAGRALRQFRQPVTGQQFALQQLQRIAKQTKMAPEELAEHLAKVDLTDPVKVAGLSRTLIQHSFGDKLTALWYFSLLSSPVTHIKNTISNAVVTTTRPVESLASAAVDVGRAAVTRTPRERYFGEAGAQVVGMRAAFTDGVRSSYEILRRGFTEAEATLKPELAYTEPFRGRVADLTVNVPGRLLRSSDVFFRTLNKTATLYADAYRMASREGLKGDALYDEAARLIVSPTKEMLERAEKEGAYRVFQQDGTFVRQMGQLRQEVPALRFLIPFIQTPYNIGKFALERSPAALLKIGSEVATPAGRAELRAKGAGDFSDRLARMLLGSATMFSLVEYARQGNLTGAAPIDPTDKDAFFRQGKQAYSMRNPVTGEWFSYAGLQPYTTIFSAATEMEKMQRVEPGKPSPDLLTGIAVTSLALGRATLDQPWTDGLAEFLDFLSGTNVRDPEDLMDSAGKYAARQSRVLVPAVARWVATATDPTIREPERGIAGVSQTIASGVPGFQDTAPEKLTAFGQPAPRQVTGLQTLNPLASAQPNADPVEQELARLDLRGFNVQPGFVGKTITVGTEQVELETTERRRYQEASGMLAYELLTDAIGSPEWQQLSDVGRQRAVDRLVARARDVVRAQLGAEPPIRQRAVESRERRLTGAAR